MNKYKLVPVAELQRGDRAAAVFTSTDFFLSAMVFKFMDGDVCVMGRPMLAVWYEEDEEHMPREVGVAGANKALVILNDEGEKEFRAAFNSFYEPGFFRGKCVALRYGEPKAKDVIAKMPFDAQMLVALGVANTLQ